MIIKFLKSAKFYMPIIYIVVGMILYYIIARTISKLSKLNIKKVSDEYDKRKATVISLINNIIKYIILSTYGVNTTSIIASLGAVSVIIGLAFQDIIKDFLAGIFIIFDNAYAVGDYIEINGFKGEVISLGLKTTKIKSFSGEVKILSNSSFTEVINCTMNHSKLVITVPFSYNEKIEKIEKALNKVKEKIEENKDVYTMDLLGVDKFDDSSMHYAILIECVPMKHIGIKREVLKLIKQTFDTDKIEIPYNQLDIHLKDKV